MFFQSILVIQIFLAQVKPKDLRPFQIIEMTVFQISPLKNWLQETGVFETKSFSILKENPPVFRSVSFLENKNRSAESFLFFQKHPPDR